MAKQSALDKAIEDLRQHADPLHMQLAAINTAIEALERQRVVKKAQVRSARKPKETAVAAEVKP